MNQAPLTPSLSPSAGERVPEGRVRGMFIAPMSGWKTVGLSMNLVGRAYSRALISALSSFSFRPGVAF